MNSNYWILANRDGCCLAVDGPHGRLSANPHVGDEGVFRRTGARLTSAVGDIELRVSESGTVESPLGTFKARPGPSQLPSEHLAELEEHGFTVLEQVVEPSAINRLKTALERARTCYDVNPRSVDGRVSTRHGLSWSVEVGRAVTHPVALWLMQAYLGTDAIHYCHPPGVTTLRPAEQLRGTRPPGGWHADYPYHPGIFPDDVWPAEPPFGLQFNICVDAFRADNAATQYLPGSHRYCRRVADEFNAAGTHMGEGIHRDVTQMLAPAGAALIYDSRNWHRACEELNVSGTSRVAILNAVTPAWVPPMTDRSDSAALFRCSPAAAALSARERADVQRLCLSSPLPRPEGMPALRPRRQR